MYQLIPDGNLFEKMGTGHGKDGSAHPITLEEYLKFFKVLSYSLLPSYCSLRIISGGGDD